MPKSPWDSVAGGSSPTSSGSSKNPWDNIGGAASSGGGGGGLLGTLKDIGSAALGSAPVQTALNVVDTPRAAIVSTLKELSDLSASSQQAGEHFSLSDLVNQTRDHIGAGQLINNGKGTGNIWLDRGLGFVGDVALDPLTYATFGATSLADGAHLGYKEVADKALARLGEGGTDAANRVLRARSAMALTADEAAQAGVRRGASIGLGSWRASGKAGEALSEARAALTNPLFDKSAESRYGTWLAKATDPIAATMVELRHSNPAAARQLETAMRVTRGEGRSVTEKALVELNDIFKANKNLDRGEIARLVENGTARAAGLAADVAAPEAQAAQKLGDWLEKVRVVASDMSGREIPKYDNYLPRRLTEDFRAYLESKGKTLAGSANAKQAFEQMREYRVGTQWLGETLHDGTAEEMERIAREKLGSDYVQVFQNDPWRLAKSYANEVGRMVERERFGTALNDLGLVQHLDAGAVARDASKADTQLSKIGKSRRDMFRSGRRAAAADAEAQSLAATVGDIAAPAASTDLHAAAEAARGAADIAKNDAADLANQGMDLQAHLESLGAKPATDPAALHDAQAALAKVVAEHAAAADAPHVATAASTKLRREIETLAAQKADLETQRLTITHAAAQTSRAADTSAAEIRRALDYTSANFDPQRAAFALRSTGDSKLAEIADEIDAALQDTTISRKARMAEVRQAAHDGRVHWAETVAANAEQVNQEALRVHRNVLSAEGVGGEVASNADTIKQVRDLDAKIARVESQIEARTTKLNTPVMSATEASAKVAVERKVAEASRVVADEQSKFDAARAAQDGWESELSSINTRLGEIESEMKQASKRAQTHLAEERSYLREADRLAKAANAQQDKTLSEIARLESVFQRERARMTQFATKMSDHEATMKALRVPERQAELERMVHDGLRRGFMGDETAWSSPELAAVVNEVGEKFSGKQVGAFLKMYDSTISRWKAYSLLSPGFHIRNYMGGLFNNWLAGVDWSTRLRNTRALMQYSSGGLDAIKDAEIRGIYEHIERLAVVDGHNIRDLADVGGEMSRDGLLRRASRAVGMDSPGLNKIDPTSLDNSMLHLNTTIGSRVERTLRSELFVDRMLKGDTPENALNAVIKYHFDYSELSTLEQNVGRRLIPFYTWTRKNFPLQIENFLAQPGKYNRYMIAKRNLELGNPQTGQEPAYYQRLLAMRLPFGKGDRYLTLDLPFVNMGEMLNGQAFTSGLTPAIKTPIELWANKSTFTGLPLQYKGEAPQPIPTVFAPLAPILEQLDGTFGLPRVTRGPHGEYLMGRADAYKVEQALPLLGRLRRLAPSEPKYQDRALTTYLSYLAGIGSRTLTPGDIQAELSRRSGSN